MNIAIVARSAHVPGIELFSARYTHHTFGRHAHPTLAIGVVDHGRGEFWYRGATHVAPRDALVLIGPGESHTGGVARGAPIVDGVALEYRMIYLAHDVVATLTGLPADAWRFAEPAPNDPHLAAELRALHRALAEGDDGLRVESRIATVLRLIAEHYAPRPLGETPRRRTERSSLSLARDYLHAHLAAPLSLSQLAAIVGLHPAYLNRAFSATFGLPPHAYRTHLRLERARAMLAAGRPVTHVAYEVGFADQAQLTRHFTKAFGISPARYRMQMNHSARVDR